MKKAISVLLAIMMVMTALPLGILSAFAETSGDFKYYVLSESDKTCAIYGHNGFVRVLTIPSQIDGYTVTKIGNNAFEYCTSLTSVTIPDSVTSIGYEAFSNTAYYKNEENWKNDVLYIGHHLIKAREYISGAYTVKMGTKTIADSAFSDCKSLTSMTIPDSVTSIGWHAFYGCTALTSVTIPNSVTSIGEKAFGGTAYYSNEENWENDVLYIGHHLIKAREYISGAYTVKTGTKTIADSAFSDCKSLTSMTIPDSVTSIGNCAFSDCTSLINAVIPDSVTSMGEAAFFDCDSLTSVTIPNSVKSIRNRVFEGCTSLTNVIIPDSVTGIENYAFENCTSLTSVTIPDSVTSIGDHAFYDCTSLTNAVIPDSVTSIGEKAFFNCDSLTSVTIPDSVTRIGYAAFSYCTSLTAISVNSGNAAYSSADGVLFNKDKTILFCFPAGKTDDTYIVPDSVTSIEGTAFAVCTSLTSVTIPNSVTTIGNYAFESCTSLTSVTIPDSVMSIQWSAFYGCKSLISVTIPDSVTRIENYAFENCTSLTSVTIPDSVTSIGEDAFRGCTSLTSVTIADSVTSIGYEAFRDTAYYNNAENWENDVLYIGHHLIKARESISGAYTVKTGTKTIADEAFQNCTYYLTSVTIPDGVTYIGKSAFLNCAFLKSVMISDSVTSIGSRAFGYSGYTKVKGFTVYGYSGSAAETYATDHEFNFIDISTGAAVFIPFSQNGISLSVFDKTAFLEGNIDFSGEHSGSAQHRLKGVRLTADSTSENFDKTTFLTTAYVGKTVTLSKNGYQNYTVPAEVVDSWFNSDAIATQNIYMTKDRQDGKPYISGAYAKESGKSVAYTDLQSESLTAMANTPYDIILSTQSGGEAVTEYVLSQDDAHKLTSKNGVFSAKTLSETFEKGKDVYAYVKTASGKTSEPIKVELQITELSLNKNTFSLIGKDGQSLTFAKDAPIVGNATLSLDGFKFPLGIEIEGNRFKISFGIDLFSIEKENDQPWDKKDDENSWNFFKANVQNMLNDVESQADKLKEFKKFYKTVDPNQYHDNFYNNKKINFDTSFLGYAEGYIVNEKMVYTDFCGEVAAKFTFNYTQQGTVWAIPVYAYVEAGASTAIQMQSVRALPDNDVPFDFGINLNIEPELTIGGGIGVKGAISGGLYGKGSLPVDIRFAEKHANVKLSGEIGVEGEIFCFKGKKTIVDGTITLCDKYYGTAKTATRQNMLRQVTQNFLAYNNSEDVQNQTVTTVMPRDYAKETSKWLGISFLDRLFNFFSFKVFSDSEQTVADGLTVKELQTSVFKNSQTQLISLDDGKMMMAWIEDDSARDTYNRMRLVYSIYENGLWSKPKAVSDDGTNDGYPSLATDGKTVYIAWQNLKCNLTETDADSIDAILKNSEICISKYNAAEKQFENEKALTSNEKYDYSPSLAVENEQAVLYWVQSSDNNLSAAGSNTLYRYTTTDGTTTTVKSELNYMPDMECAFVNGKDEVAFSMDTDGNLTTTGDIFAYTLANGVLTQQTPNEENPSADFTVTYGMMNGQNTLFFADSTDVYYKKNGEVKKVFSSPRAICGDLQVVENGTETNLFWTEISDAGTELWQCRCSDGVWSEPVQISNIGALLHDVRVVYHNGNVHGVFDRTARTQENGEYINGQTDLCYMTLADYTNLEASMITVDESEFTIGETAEIPVYLKNNGTQDITEVEITLTDTLGTSKTVCQSVALPSGAETVIYVAYDVPSNYKQTALTVTAGIPNTEDINSANNTDSLQIGNANVAVSEISVNDIGEYFVLSAVVTNRNAFAVQNARVEILTDNEKGKLLDFVTLGNLQTGEMSTVQFTVLKSSLQYDADNLAKICFSVKTDSKENITVDNTSYAVLEKGIAESDTLLGDIDGSGEIDDWDSVLLDRYLAGWDVEIDTSVADMDGSGDVDDWDSVLLARKLAGWNV